MPLSSLVCILSIILKALPVSVIGPLQSILNPAARVVLLRCNSGRVTPLLAVLQSKNQSLPSGLEALQSGSHYCSDLISHCCSQHLLCFQPHWCLSLSMNIAGTFLLGFYTQRFLHQERSSPGLCRVHSSPPSGVYCHVAVSVHQESTAMSQSHWCIFGPLYFREWLLPPTLSTLFPTLFFSIALIF